MLKRGKLVLKKLQHSTMQYFFHYGHDSRLSSAEIFQLFPESIERIVPQWILVSWEDLQKHGDFCGGIPKISQVIEILDTPKKIEEKLIHAISFAAEQESGGRKFNFALANYGGKISIFSLGIRIKKQLSLWEGSFRCLNKSDAPIHTAVYKREIQKHGGEWNLIQLSQTQIALTRTVFMQDIDAYAHRDFWKKRDTQVGMLPPKLAQLFLHLVSPHIHGVFDPFCGLWTIPLEASRDPRWKGVFAADRAESMVEATKENAQFYKENFDSRWNIECFEADATLPWGTSFWIPTAVVTEWYLGALMTPQVPDTILREEATKLQYLYEKFLYQAQKHPDIQEIVFTSPAWKLRTGELIEVAGIEDAILQSWWEMEALFPGSPITRYGISRENQRVVRMLRKLVRAR
jgi:tRNA G10  N-methylase Trm11